MNLRFYIVFHGGVSHLLSISFHANSQPVLYLVWCSCNNNSNLKMLPALKRCVLRINLMLRLCRIPPTITKGPRLQRRGGALRLSRAPRRVFEPKAVPRGAGAARCPPRDARERRRRRKRERGRFLCLCRAGPAAPGAAAAPTPAARGGRHGRVREPAQEDAHQGTGSAGRAGSSGAQRREAPGSWVGKGGRAQRA